MRRRSRRTGLAAHHINLLLGDAAERLDACEVAPNVIQQRGEVMNKMRAALAAGKEVTVHHAPITYAGFDGAGYVIVDKEMGADRYLILSGTRGGVLDRGVGAGFGALGVVASFLAYASLLPELVGTASAPIGLIGLPIGLIALAVAVAVATLITLYSSIEAHRARRFLGGFAMPFALLGGGVSRVFTLLSQMSWWIAVMFSGSGLLQCL